MLIRENYVNDSVYDWVLLKKTRDNRNNSRGPHIRTSSQENDINKREEVKNNRLPQPKITHGAPRLVNLAAQGRGNMR